jgi:hypothetical protein
MRIDSAGRIWRVAYFRTIAIGESFKCNGNTWRKQSSRTAKGLSDGLPYWPMYFRQGEVCESCNADS